MSTTVNNMPTGRWLVENGVVTNLPEDAAQKDKCIQQIGVDLVIDDIYECVGTPSVGFSDKQLPKLRIVDRNRCLDSGRLYWLLEQGFYDITFKQGCKIPNNMALMIRQRSTLLRGGALLHSSVFDPGFECDQMGTVLHIHNPEGFKIYEGARLAQIYAHFCDAVAENDLYGSVEKGSSYQNNNR